MYSAKGLQASPWRGCPIRTSPDQSLLAAPRGFSQPSTSFIGSWCQGIHRAPLLARRLDLSNHQAGRINVLVSFVSSNPTLSTALGSAVPNVCICLLNYSLVLQVQFSLAFDQRFRAVNYVFRSRAPVVAPLPWCGSSRHDRLPLFLFTYGHKKGPTSVEPHMATASRHNGLCDCRIQLADDPDSPRLLSKA